MRARLLEALGDAQTLGFLGPGPVENQLQHAEAFAELIGDPAGPFLDLGSGAGLPGLAVALAYPDTDGALLDSQHRRAEFLEATIARLGLSPRIRLIHARAEDAARDPAHRAQFALVTARSFGPPAVTAECATAFLLPGGRLAVSDPPNPDPTRWPPALLALLGLSPPEIRHSSATTVAILHQLSPTPARYPRRPGIPTKRPLW